MNQILIVCQGQPGSGKSTLVREHLAPMLVTLGHTVVICSTDDYFVVDGVYKFDPSKLGQYHQANLRCAIESMKNGKTVILDNTNTHAWECKDYVKMAVELNIPVSFHRVSGNYTSVHGVPADKVASMKQRMEVLTLESVLNSKRPF